MNLSDFHFLRPWWWIAILPLALLLVFLKRRKDCGSWQSICDPHLLQGLLQVHGGARRDGGRWWAALSVFCMIFGLAGPAWQKLPVPTFSRVEPRVLVLDMSERMQEKDVLPNRLARAKFKLQDVLTHHDAGQFALIAYTGEAFLVSPLTRDGNTIISLLPELTPDVMPVGGSKLAGALADAGKLLREAGFPKGQILVLAATPPDTAAVDEARKLAQSGITTSVLPVLAKNDNKTAFRALADAGDGMFLPFSDTPSDVDAWLSSHSGDFVADEGIPFPLWQDEGRWLAIPALLALLPLFRRRSLGEGWA